MHRTGIGPMSRSGEDSGHGNPGIRGPVPAARVRRAVAGQRAGGRGHDHGRPEPRNPGLRADRLAPPDRPHPVSPLLPALPMFAPSLVQVAGAGTLMSAADTSPPRRLLIGVSAVMAGTL